MGKLLNEYDRFYEPPEDTTVYHCPACGAVLEGCDEVYVVLGEVVGCWECVREKRACEIMGVA